MSLLSDAVESLLRDKEIRAALLDFLKGNTPDKRECWREIWRYADNERRTYHLKRDPITGMTNIEQDVELIIVAKYSDEAGVGWIGAYWQPYRENRNSWEVYDWGFMRYLYQTSLIGSYTEVILHSQTDALTESRAAFALEVERLQNA